MGLLIELSQIIVIHPLRNAKSESEKFICRIPMAKRASNKEKTLFTSKSDLNVRKKLIKCYIWSTAFYDVEISTLRKVDQKYLKSLKCGAGEEWRRAV
jgi:hypothetical protein